MKIDGTIDIQNMEYTETCKTIRKKVREDIRNFNTKMIKTTIEQNGSLKKVKNNLAQRRQNITNILDSNGQKILMRIEEFYKQLYDSDTQTEEPEKSNKLIPHVTDWEVKHTINYTVRGKVPGPDNILIDTIKDRNNIINKELPKLLSASLKRGKVPQ